ncbi:SDR family oxidoreductase [Acidocella sp.]|uniref:SDR family oxidoreductase n=1 Tax=Acidocella sp. TaxID=50710 RepID=UPI002618522A|nr:SDR family oxidoreductase [Acidocella sp.]
MPDAKNANQPENSVSPQPQYLQALTGQPALITGASSGIGKAIALGLAKAGADVVVNYIGNPLPAEDVAHEIEMLGRRAMTIEADVSQEDAVERMFADAIQHFGTLHITISNAGLQADAPFDEMTLAQWNKVIGVNLTGQFLTARAAVREFKRRGPQPEISVASGKLLCTSSVHQEIPWAGHVNYATSKGGINMMMRSIAQEVAPLRIRVNAIAPGAIRTPINRAAWDTPQAYDRLMGLVPYLRIGEPDDIARAAAWLVSDAADYITGATLYIDGGMTLYPGFATGG